MNTLRRFLRDTNTAEAVGDVLSLAAFCAAVGLLLTILPAFQ